MLLLMIIAIKYPLLIKKHIRLHLICRKIMEWVRPIYFDSDQLKRLNIILIIWKIFCFKIPLHVIPLI